jgi:signal peptidase I
MAASRMTPELKRGDWVTSPGLKGDRVLVRKIEYEGGNFADLYFDQYVTKTGTHLPVTRDVYGDPDDCFAHNLKDTSSDWHFVKVTK